MGALKVEAVRGVSRFSRNRSMESWLFDGLCKTAPGSFARTVRPWRTLFLGCVYFIFLKTSAIFSILRAAIEPDSKVLAAPLQRSSNFSISPEENA